jgi:hypothetical protein
MGVGGGMNDIEQLRAEVARLNAEVEFYRTGMTKVAEAVGVTTPLELIMLAENNEETYVDLLIKWIKRTNS